MCESLRDLLIMLMMCRELISHSEAVPVIMMPRGALGVAPRAHPRMHIKEHLKYTIMRTSISCVFAIVTDYTRRFNDASTEVRSGRTSTLHAVT